MLKRRIIPCLDVKDGRTVKGVNFVGLRDAGDPVELAALYAEQGADELVFLDITATHEKRKTLKNMVRRVAQAINIPFTVGGGISSVEDVEVLLQNGADKVSVNSSIVRKPELITELSDYFGEQCIVAAIDGKQEQDGSWQACLPSKDELDNWQVYISGGRTATGLELFAWAKEVVDRGAGEILFTSMDNDGTKSGFAIDALQKMNELVSVPIIASGGAGSIQHFQEVYEAGIDAALAASIFHFKEISIPEMKTALNENGLAIRV